MISRQATVARRPAHEGVLANLLAKQCAILAFWLGSAVLLPWSDNDIRREMPSWSG